MSKVHIYRPICFLILLNVFILLSVYPAQAASLPTDFSESVFASTLSDPTAMEFAPDGRLFVAQQGGALRVILQDGTLLPTPFVTISVNSSGERGLLGIAFDPNFASNQFVYVYYTATSPMIHNRVSRFTANGNVASGSEVVILDLEDLFATNHNGGAIHFGPDGKLYVAVGENAVTSNAQTLNNRLGKILRINSDGSIPTDNPFYSTATGLNRSIWALGLRNPFTFAFQPGTGRMFINDVGAGLWEEINDGIAGSNYGWPDTEGETTNPLFRSPLFAYPHGGGNTSGCAIAGGAFYNPPSVQFPPDYVGDYFFADLCNNWIRRYDPATDTATGFATATTAALVDLKVGGDGSLYYLARGTGSTTGVVYRVRYTPPPPPSNVNLLTNGNFSAGLTGWQTFNLTPAQVNGGVFETALPGSFSSGALYQLVNQTLPSAVPMEYTISLGNSSAVNKTAQLVLRNPDWSEVRTCTFTIPAGAPLQTYTLRALTGSPWFTFYAQVWLYSPDSQMALRVDNANVQYKPGLVLSGTECLSPAPPSNVNLLTNGDFSTGLTGWQTFNLTPAQVNGGVFETALPGSFSSGALYQLVNQTLPSGAPMEYTLSLGNSSGVNKTAQLLLRNPDWSEVRACTFTVPAGAPLQTYTLRALTGSSWSTFYAQLWLYSPDSQMALRVDNANVQYKPGLVVSGTECINAALPPNTSAVINGDFSAGLTGWQTFNLTPAQVNGGVFETALPGGVSAGALYQLVNQTLPSGAPMEYTLSLGNSSGVNKTAQLLLRNPDWSEVRACTFTVPAGAPLQTYTLRALTGTSWSTFYVQLWLYSPDSQMALRVDNVNVQYKPSLVLSGTECDPIGGIGLGVPLTSTATETATPTGTATLTVTLESSATATETPTPTETPLLPTETATETPAPTETFTWTPLPTETPTPSDTPIPDSDGDTVPDNLDACPAVPGSPPTGCPPTETPLPTATFTETPTPESPTAAP